MRRTKSLNSEKNPSKETHGPNDLYINCYGKIDKTNLLQISVSTVSELPEMI